jgi:hypothetical protein
MKQYYKIKKLAILTLLLLSIAMCTKIPLFTIAYPATPTFFNVVNNIPNTSFIVVIG